MRNPIQGFTLIELLIVIAIIGLLSAVLIPNVLAARARAYDSSAAGCAKHIATAQETVYIDGQTYSADLAALNSSTNGMAGNCDASWVDDANAFTDGWEVHHPRGSGLVYTVVPGGIQPSP